MFVSLNYNSIFKYPNKIDTTHTKDFCGYFPSRIFPSRGLLPDDNKTCKHILMTYKTKFKNLKCVSLDHMTTQGDVWTLTNQTVVQTNIITEKVSMKAEL